MYYMPKTKGPDIEKTRLIRKALARSPKGLWVREIARRTGLDKSTVSRYLGEYMKHEIEHAYPKIKGNLIRMVRSRRK